MMQSKDSGTVNLAFKQLYDRHFDALQRTAIYFLKGDDVAYDMVLNVFLKIYENRDQLETVEDFRKYYNEAVRNQAVKYLQRMAKGKLVESEFVRVTELVRERNEIKAELYRRMVKFTDHLPRRQREVFRLAKLEGYTYKEIAEILSLSENTIKRNMTLAMKALRKKFSGFRV
jgi:RNA polymerase sigma-70 factor (ECF subfamily)